MRTITAFEAKTRFGDLLDRVSRGEEIVITRHDKPVAGIIPEGRPPLSQIREAGMRLLALQESMRKQPGFRPVSLSL